MFTKNDCVALKAIDPTIELPFELNISEKFNVYRRNNSFIIDPNELSLKLFIQYALDNPSTKNIDRLKENKYDISKLDIVNICKKPVYMEHFYDMIDVYSLLCEVYLKNPKFEKYFFERFDELKDIAMKDKNSLFTNATILILGKYPQHEERMLKYLKLNKNPFIANALCLANNIFIRPSFVEKLEADHIINLLINRDVTKDQFDLLVEYININKITDFKAVIEAFKRFPNELRHIIVDILEWNKRNKKE